MTTQRHYICFKFSSKTLKSASEVKILRKYVILEEKMTEITFVLNSTNKRNTKTDQNKQEPGSRRARLVLLLITKKNNLIHQSQVPYMYTSTNSAISFVLLEE